MSRMKPRRIVLIGFDSSTFELLCPRDCLVLCKDQENGGQYVRHIRC